MRLLNCPDNVSSRSNVILFCSSTDTDDRRKPKLKRKIRKKKKKKRHRSEEDSEDGDLHKPSTWFLSLGNRQFLPHLDFKNLFSFPQL